MASPVHDHSDLTPSSLLVDFLPLLPKGKVLDVAMGKGRHSLYLAAKGFEVEGVEIDEASVRVCNEEAKKRGVNVRTRVADLTRDFRIPPASYDVILCFYYLDRDLIPQIREGLKEGGMILYETFLIDQHLKTGKPGRREFCFQRNELLRFFKDFRVLYYREGFVSEDRATAGLVAEKGGLSREIEWPKVV
jgi:SAM-dependent methyltransferase